MKCPVCEGSGQCSICKGEGLVTCVHCGGEGKEEIVQPPGQARIVKCLFCEGHGTLTCNPMCERCRGFGDLRENEELAVKETTLVPVKKESRSFVSWELLLINLAFFIAGALCVTLFRKNYILYICALNGDRVMAGEVWRLVTSMFVHLGYIHLLLNLFMLCFLAPPLEKIIGARKFLYIYFLAGLAGNLLTILLKPAIWSVGASGAIYGLIGAYFTLHYRFRPFYAGLMGQLIVFVIVDFFTALIPAMHINVLAHLGGFVGGIVIAYFLTIAGLEPVEEAPETLHY